MRVARYLSSVIALTVLCGLSVPAIASADYSSSVIADGPLAYYHLDEADGQPLAADSSGSIPPADGSYAATGVGYSVAGPFPGTGSGTAVALTSGTVAGSVSGVAHSASLWINPSARVAQTFLEHGDSAADGWSIGIAPNNTPRGGKRKLFFESHGVSVNSKIALASGTWSMVSVTWDAAKVSFYVNGGAITKAINTPAGWTAPGPAADPTLTVGPGAGPGGTSFDEVAIFPGTLSKNQLAAHYATTLLPVVASTPVLSPLTGVREGDTLSLTPGTYSGGVVQSQQWQRCDANAACTDIAGATGTAYTLTAADVDYSVQVEETATNANGSVSVVSDATDPVLALPAIVTPPVTPLDPGTSAAPATISTPDPVSVQNPVSLLPTSCPTSRLAAVKARSARVGKAKVTLKLNAKTRRVSVRAKRGTIRMVTFRLDGKRRKARKGHPFTLVIRRAWTKPGKHTLKASVKPRHGKRRTLTLRLVAKPC